MYRITTEEGKKEYLETVLYIKKQDNDTIVICNEEEAQGFLNKDSSIIYAMSGKGLEEQYETADLQQITLDAFIDEYVIGRLEEVETQNAALIEGAQSVQ